MPDFEACSNLISWNCGREITTLFFFLNSLSSGFVLLTKEKKMLQVVEAKKKEVIEKKDRPEKVAYNKNFC